MRICRNYFESEAWRIMGVMGMKKMKADASVGLRGVKAGIYMPDVEKFLVRYEMEEKCVLVAFEELEG